MLKLTKKDHAVIKCFVEGWGGVWSSKHLDVVQIADGRLAGYVRLDIIGLGGTGVAYRDRQGNVCVNDLGSRSGQTVAHAIQKRTKTTWCSGL